MQNSLALKPFFTRLTKKIKAAFRRLFLSSAAKKSKKLKDFIAS